MKTKEGKRQEQRLFLPERLVHKSSTSKRKISLCYKLIKHEKCENQEVF